MLEYPSNHEIMFELMSVNHSIIAIIFFIFFNIKVCCVFLLESPHRDDSNENTQYTIFNLKKRKKKITLNYSKSMGFLLGT